MMLVVGEEEARVVPLSLPASGDSEALVGVTIPLLDCPATDPPTTDFHRKFWKILVSVTG